MLCLKVADNPPKKQRILVGLVNSTAALLLYAPLAGYLCSFSVASQSIAIRYNLSTISVSSLNSIAFGLSVGLGPLTKQFIFDKLGLYKGTIVGYAIAMLGMLSSAYASEYWQLILTYSVLASIGNNCCYMGLNCLAEGWLAGTRWLTTGAVLVSCAISVGTWLGNSASSALQQKIKNETLASLIQSSASNSNEILLDATSSSKTLTNQDFLISSKFIQQRFLLFAAAILVALAGLSR